ncbi:putative CRAL TRIO domain protein [Rosellinia necatrix]|uniref:Putative CRAL TRIO domain protein n=1 Tax=Rosellinia necatrix TaxID=77044 RepID=A0A1W2TFI9_ROSNE|nr:putative CRAL TRIO domain protein [Rosellinia necatrix]
MENGQQNGSTTGELRSNAGDNGKLDDSTTGLTGYQQQRFESFVEQCREEGLLERPVGLVAEDALDGLNDEVTLLRFLSARSFDAPGALAQFKEAQTIRNSVNSAEHYNGIDIDDFEHLRRMYPHWSGHRTKRGLPICTLDVANLDGSNLAKFNNCTPSEATCRAITSLDYLTRFVLPLCSAMTDRPDPSKPVSNAVYLVDITYISLRQAWGVRRYAQSITGLLATCYPEVVDKIYVLNAPPYFSKIWAFIKSWIDPNTAKKLVIVPPEDVLTTLSETIDVECIPERYGGKSKAKDGELPSVAGLQDLLGVQELPEGPIKWATDQGIRTAVAVGVRGGEARREVLSSASIKAAL